MLVLGLNHYTYSKENSQAYFFGIFLFYYYYKRFLFYVNFDTIYNVPLSHLKLLILVVQSEALLKQIGLSTGPPPSCAFCCIEEELVTSHVLLVLLNTLQEGFVLETLLGQVGAY
jgi:hypothetical protein